MMRRRTGAFGAALLAALLLWTATAGALGLPQVSEIPAGAGSHGYPYDAVPTTATFPGAPTINLASYGFIEREFKVSGTTNVYRQSGLWLPDGRWGVSVAQMGVPYTTRLLVRYPTDPSKFNGTVVVEWLNDTTGGDQDPVWSEIYNQVLTQGYAYVGVSAQTGSMNELKAWDPQRYGSLGDSSDGQSYDIFSQAAALVRSESATILGGLTPRTIIGAGDSQSAFRVDTYVNAIQPISHAFNGFMAIGRAVAAAPLGNGLLAAAPAPAYIRTDNAAPFIQINTEGDVEEFADALVRQPDSNTLRTWELPGAAHIDLHEGLYESATISRESPQVAAPNCVFGVRVNGVTQPDNMPVNELEDAALTALQKWITSGVQPPHGSPIATIPLSGIVLRDQFGNALGGIRYPDIQVPTESYSAINFAQPSQQSLSLSQITSTLESIFSALSTGVITDQNLRSTGLCLLEGYYTPFGSPILQLLYPTHGNYVSRFTAAAASSLAGGFLTPADYASAVAAAQAAPVP
jgi:hypothetical protein